MTRQNGWVKCFLLFHLFTFSLFTSRAQCGIENTAFKSGEELAYDLYFNWKFIWVKVGTAEMDTKMAKFEGKDAWKSYLITRGNPNSTSSSSCVILCSPIAILISRPSISAKEHRRAIVIMLMRYGIAILMATVS